MIFPVDTLVYDADKIAAYQADKRFDYNSQLGVPEFDLSGWLRKIISEWLIRPLTAGDTTNDIFRLLLIVFFVVAVGLVVYFIYKKRPEFFTREKKNPLAYEVEEENIYRINFEHELAKALETGDFRRAVRVLYLQTLRLVADRQWIDWQIYKTPTEYTYELKPARLKIVFRDFTNCFLQVRYGNIRATRDMFDIMCVLRDEIRKGGEHENIK
ncbi:MAG: DUF4129 domain-containing protein [Tannerella sp.]|nr:DUF4129 domain-containing protein [Tannerella sp.]